MTTEGDIAQSWVRTCEKSERKEGFGLGGAVDNRSDERTGTREFEGEMFKRQGGSDRDGYFNVLSVNSGNATCPSLSTWFVCVGESCWCDLVKCEVVQGFVPGFSDAEEVQFVVSDEFIQDESFIA